jgi:hypothetical protein
VVVYSLPPCLSPSSREHTCLTWAMAHGQWPREEGGYCRRPGAGTQIPKMGRLLCDSLLLWGCSHLVPGLAVLVSVAFMSQSVCWTDAGLHVDMARHEFAWGGEGT